jgi:hypothetical protein
VKREAQRRRRRTSRWFDEGDIVDAPVGLGEGRGCWEERPMWVRMPPSECIYVRHEFVKKRTSPGRITWKMPRRCVRRTMYVMSHTPSSLIFKTVVSLEKGPDEVGSYQTLSSYFVLLFHRDSESKHISLA